MSGICNKPKPMKRILLLTLSLTFALGSMAQLAKDQSKYAKKVPRYAIDDAELNPLQPHNNTVSSKSTLEDQLGQTRYDMQTNASSQNRFYVYPDGTMAGTWTRGMMDSTYADLGTGYNFFDGANWGAVPSARIESIKTGWPSYGPWNGNGEFVIAHNLSSDIGYEYPSRQRNRHLDTVTHTFSPFRSYRYCLAQSDIERNQSSEPPHYCINPACSQWGSEI